MEAKVLAAIVLGIAVLALIAWWPSRRRTPPPDPYYRPKEFRDPERTRRRARR
jgi:hypothetical protein